MTVEIRKENLCKFPSTNASTKSVQILVFSNIVYQEASAVNFVIVLKLRNMTKNRNWNRNFDVDYLKKKGCTSLPLLKCLG